jgi:CHC2 zinc finger
MPHEWVNYKSLRAELSFIEILHHYGVELKERGEQWQGFCPLPTHEGKRQSPSFSANVGRGIWQCFGVSGRERFPARGRREFYRRLVAHPGRDHERGGAHGRLLL